MWLNLLNLDDSVLFCRPFCLFCCSFSSGNCVVCSCKTQRGNEFTLDISATRGAQSCDFCLVFCWPLFVSLSFSACYCIVCLFQVTSGSWLPLWHVTPDYPHDIYYNEQYNYPDCYCHPWTHCLNVVIRDYLLKVVECVHRFLCSVCPTIICLQHSARNELTFLMATIFFKVPLGE